MLCAVGSLCRFTLDTKERLHLFFTPINKTSRQVVQIVPFEDVVSVSWDGCKWGVKSSVDVRTHGFERHTAGLGAVSWTVVYAEDNTQLEYILRPYNKDSPGPVQLHLTRDRTFSLVPASADEIERFRAMLRRLRTVAV